MSDLAQITMPNISGCSSMLSTQVLTRKERIYGPVEMEMVVICENSPFREEFISIIDDAGVYGLYHKM